MVSGLAATAAVLLAGCESATTPQVSSAAEHFVAAVRSADHGAACDLLALQVRDTIESASAKPCEQAMGAIELPTRPVIDMVVWGDAARVRTAEDTLFLRELPDGWRITGAGCRPRGERSYSCAVGGP